MNRKHERPSPGKPRWLKKGLPPGPEYERVRRILKSQNLHTVCQEARCPNLWECFSRHTATFMILGNRCTRNCRFCAVTHGEPEAPDPGEPRRIAETAFSMGLCHVVVTSVTRDDLPDGGAAHFAATVYAIRERLPEATVEVLVPDFRGDSDALRTVTASRPDVFNHNVETVERLYPAFRPGAGYDRSLELLRRVKEFDESLVIKSGLMLGLGETAEELTATLRDLRTARCDILTLGQYLQPTAANLPVGRYVPPEEFDAWKERALEMGFRAVASGPHVRSSYHAGELLETAAKG